MNYTLIWEMQEIELPEYTFTIAEGIEKCENQAHLKKTYKDKCKVMYDFIKSILGAETLNELIGDFKNCDPNKINLIYLRIVSAYNKPITDYEKERDFGDDDNISDIKETIQSLNNLPGVIEKLQKMKDNR